MGEKGAGRATKTRPNAEIQTRNTRNAQGQNCQCEMHGAVDMEPSSSTNKGRGRARGGGKGGECLQRNELAKFSEDIRELPNRLFHIMHAHRT